MKIKMMPGESPYSEEELDRLYGLIEEALAAEELFSIDELDTNRGGSDGHAKDIRRS